MSKVNIKTAEERRKTRSGADIFGTKEKPRLSVFRSNKYVYAQLIDDLKGNTLVTVDDVSKKIHSEMDQKSKAAHELGKILAERALDRGIEEVIFDKGSYKYHGRVRKLAEGAREGGLKF